MSSHKWWEGLDKAREPDETGAALMPLDPRIVALLKKLDPDTQCPTCRGIGALPKWEENHSYRTWGVKQEEFSWQRCLKCKGTGVKP